MQSTQQQQQMSTPAIGETMRPVSPSYLESMPTSSLEELSYCSASHIRQPYSSTTSTPFVLPASTCSNSSSSSSSSPPSVSSSPDAPPPIGVNLRVTGQCSQGGRKYMEDYFSVAYQQSDNAKDLEYAFIGIYDGHGGAEAATFAKEHLMMEIINQKLFWSDSDHDVLRAIREGYIATHYAMWREQEKWPRTANGLPSTAGTTATVAFIRREKIYIGHVGDSGIALGYQNENEDFWRATQLTTDHKPESLEERTRIMRSGGKVVVKSGVPRVVWNRPRNPSHRGPIRRKTPVDEIPFLAVARSLGDLWSYNSQRNEFVVSPDPDVKVIPINTKTFRCLIFGTDGLWNVVSPQEAVNTVREKELINERLQAQHGDNCVERAQWTNPSKSLVERALKTWSAKKMRADNTSVVTVILYPPGNGGGESGVGYNGLSDVTTISNGSVFAQPISYGLEYTQVNAEIPSYDDSATYKEMAMKYLPPEEFRNFNYYADESDEEANNVYVNQKLTTVAQPTLYGITNGWDWSTVHINASTGECGVNGDEDEDDDDDDDEDDDEDVDNNVVEGNDVNDHLMDEVPNGSEVCVVNYEAYLHAAGDEAGSSGGYINSFAESYNTLLNEQIAHSSHEAATSSRVSSANTATYQSITCPTMHEILREQQLYQQQCMSEEEGYSLTKLETRREQQRLQATDVQTFKIYQQQQQQLQHQHPHLPQQHDPAVFSEPAEAAFYDGTRCYHDYGTQHQQKPLELHSLLQQEREEEQQVALERMQMQDKLAIGHSQPQNHTNYACLHNVSQSTTPLREAVESVEEPLVEEYLEEEVISSSANDEGVQINEISSSNYTEMSCDEDLNAETLDSEVIEKIEKIEILHQRSPVIIENEKPRPAKLRKVTHPVSYSKTTALSVVSKAPKSAPCLQRIATSPKPAACVQRSQSLRRSRAHLFPNIPNENQRISMTTSSHVLRGCRRNMPQYLHNTVPAKESATGSCSKPNNVPAASLGKRQLRSNSNNCGVGVIDYSKRTLRTRNTLAKDMKAKASLVTSGLKYTTTIAKNFLRTTAASLLGGNTALLGGEQRMTPSTRRTMSGTNNNAASNGRRKSAQGKVAVTIVKNSAPHAFNLRSRQTAIVKADTMTGSPNSGSLGRNVRTTPSPVLRREQRRTLRNIHTRSVTKDAATVTPNFGKSTRVQSVGATLAVPPPSPKLINAVAAVAAATRARSLMSAKHASAGNGPSGVVSTVFGKRTALRSNGITSLGSANASPHQNTRGRVIKKLKR